MIWQDYVMGVINIVFIISLIPTLMHDEKPHWATALMTAVALYVMAGTLLTLNLWFTPFTTAVTGTEWFVLFVQSLRRRGDVISISNQRCGDKYGQI